MSRKCFEYCICCRYKSKEPKQLFVFVYFAISQIIIVACKCFYVLLNACHGCYVDVKDISIFVRSSWWNICKIDSIDNGVCLIKWKLRVVLMWDVEGMWVKACRVFDIQSIEKMLAWSRTVITSNKSALKKWMLNATFFVL